VNDSTAVVGRRVVTRRRGAKRSLELYLLFRCRDIGREHEQAWQEFSGHCDKHSHERLLEFYEVESRLLRARAARQCASRLAMRRSRHRLSLLELRHGVDAYTVRDVVELAHQLSTDAPLVDQVLTITPVEEGRVRARPPDEFTVDEVGANAPPVGVCHKSTNTRRPPR